MQDHPLPNEILASVASFLRDTVIPKSDSHTAFIARVAANAVDLVRRQLELSHAAEIAECRRLEALLDTEGTIDTLNTALADALAEGRLDMHSPGVAAHLRATTLEKLAVDQPNYSGYLAALADAPNCDAPKDI